MRTTYIEIETICIYDNEATIAASVILKGFNYSEPAYTNIFCDRGQLTDYLLDSNTNISRSLLKHLIQTDSQNTLQIDLHDINENRPWTPNNNLDLEQLESTDFPFTCYRIKA